MTINRPPIGDINTKQGLVGLGPIPSLAPVASFNLDQIQNLIETKGFLAYHYKHAYPFDKETTESPLNINSHMATKGVYYYEPRPIKSVPYGFKIEDQLTAQAIYKPGSVLINMASYYEDDKSQEGKTNLAHFSHKDLLIFPGLTDLARQLIEYNPTGPQRLQYRARGVDLLRSVEREYVCNRDFIIGEDGYIHWIKGNRPRFNNGKGEVLTCVYYYTPIYVVMALLHSLRVLPSNELGLGSLPRKAKYFPQQMVCKPSTLIEEELNPSGESKSILDWSNLPPYAEYPDSKNTTGGST